jgi:hypothetical protein
MVLDAAQEMTVSAIRSVRHRTSSASGSTCDISKAGSCHVRDCTSVGALQGGTPPHSRCSKCRCAAPQRQVRCARASVCDQLCWPGRCIQRASVHVCGVTSSGRYAGRIAGRWGAPRWRGTLKMRLPKELGARTVQARESSHTGDVRSADMLRCSRSDSRGCASTQQDQRDRWGAHRYT